MSISMGILQKIRVMRVVTRLYKSCSVQLIDQYLIILRVNQCCFRLAKKTFFQPAQKLFPALVLKRVKKMKRNNTPTKTGIKAFEQAGKWSDLAAIFLHLVLLGILDVFFIFAKFSYLGAWSLVLALKGG